MFIMTLCLFIAAWFPLLSKMVVALFMFKEGKYDNNHPREQQKRLTGFGARAVAAHQNSFEALLFFGLAILCALITKNNSWTTDALAITFIISRTFYHVFYLLDLANLRSFVWFIGFISSMWILGSSISF